MRRFKIVPLPAVLLALSLLPVGPSPGAPRQLDAQIAVEGGELLQFVWLPWGPICIGPCGAWRPNHCCLTQP